MNTFCIRRISLSEFTFAFVIAIILAIIVTATFRAKLDAFDIPLFELLVHVFLVVVVGEQLESILRGQLLEAF